LTLGYKHALGSRAKLYGCPSRSTERHADLLGESLALPGVHGNLVPDAHIAALAVEHGLTLYSMDGDFARFRGLRWFNPIAN